MSAIDRAEVTARRAGAALAIAAAVLLIPGILRSAQQRGAAAGRPELVFTPLRLVAVALGWFGTAVAAWRPLPMRPGSRARLLLLAGGTTLYLSGLGLAIAGRLALGSSYRPSSTLGLALAPEHRLVTTGPYEVVRHPMYVGLALAAVGALAVFRTWSTVWFVVQLAVLVVRAHREEELLASSFGEVWRRYVERVPPWVPRLACRRCRHDRGRPPLRGWQGCTITAGEWLRTPRRARRSTGRT